MPVPWIKFIEKDRFVVRLRGCRGLLLFVHTILILISLSLLLRLFTLSSHGFKHVYLRKVIFEFTDPENVGLLEVELGLEVLQLRLVLADLV